MRKRPIIWAFEADGHVNSYVGLCPPDGLSYEDGGTYVPSACQMWLWRRYEEWWQFVAGLKKKHRATVVRLHVGDGPDDNIHASWGLISQKKSEIVDLAEAAAAPSQKVADIQIIFRGTEAHVGKAGELEELYAKRIKGQPHPDTGTNSWWHGRIEAYGVIADAAHHPSNASWMPHTIGGGALRQAFTLVYEYGRGREAVPRYGVRAHLHHLEDSGWNHPCRVFFLPPWAMRDAYSHRKGYSGRLEPVGGIAVLVEPDGSSREFLYLKEYPRGRVWTTKKG